MTTKTFDLCSLPEVCFHSTGNEKVQPIYNNQDDYEDNFIELPTEVWDDQERLQLAGEYKCLMAQEKAIKKRMEQIKDALVSMSKAACSTGGGLMIERCVRRGSVQYSVIPQLQGVNLDDYRGDPVEYWKVTEV